MNVENLNRNAPCPCCGNQTITESGAYEICSICGWEDDPVQLANSSYKGGANSMSLDEARQLWNKQKSR